MREQDIVAAARVMRGELRHLWSADGGTRAARVDALLQRAEAGERVADDLLVLITSDALLRAELKARLPFDEDTYREASGGVAFVPLAGDGVPSTEMLYRCPTCAYTYPAFEVGEPVPGMCPDEHGPLIRVG
ncbi:hypothetical protein AR457_34310 [Streptomyces agglomeratus]|uniref:Uncharacterized protein n=2 Tax=Streptomyces agglomeratus TaxID=285458 RepID=A0A1E5PH33_9ACTN|nr:hypothetical protein AS594_34640 [Streptomyces agglomeratus]OEJ37097.1 hypothetical protein BGK70_01810 [Streptomyces agglomeratus]OEJ48449.1 hypothetical protein AR457_34310 [Streptomyces agglomeratus]OEJ49495.1 hypothetical protein BGK72_00315 [Streptomyces agglomeratus]OEJ56953.1 hypothetical protein BGM19_01865 [Streptomyces agglomeratus]